MKDLDRSLVTAGYPTEDGFHFLWSDCLGWPVLNVVRVQVSDKTVTWWRGVEGTDRQVEIPALFGFDYDKYLGSSRVTPEAVAHYSALNTQVSNAVKASLIALKG